MPLPRVLLWPLLALPAAVMVHGAATGRSVATTLLQPSGEVSLLLIIVALLAGPTADVFGRNGFLRGWLAIRRNLGVAGFAYAMLHLAFYVVDMGDLAAMLDEITLPAIWTGWLALALLGTAASISFDRAVRVLGRNWKRIQQGVYVALALALVHWALLDRAVGPALVHLAPLVIAWSLRAWVRTNRTARTEG